MGLSSVPLVGRSVTPVQVGERWCLLDTFNLQGIITGLCPDFSDLITSQKAILNAFSKQFQTFEIVENGSVVHNKPFVTINNINFPESKYTYLLPYEIELYCWPSGYFTTTGDFGVLNPTEEVTFEEQPNGLININHVTSCQGFNTSSTDSNALNNAKTWVSARTGWNNPILPQFLGISSPFTPCLKTVAENVNRLNGSYSVSESYIYDPNETEIGILRYSMVYDSGFQDGLNNIRVQGVLEGCKNTNIADLRTRYNSINIYGIGETGLNLCAGITGLNSGYLSSGVDEDNFSKRISFNVFFNDDSSPITYFDYRTSLDTDSISDISSYNFQGTIRSRGDILNRWANVSGFYNTLDIFGYIGSGYSGYNLGFPINPNALSSGTSFNRYNGVIDMNASFSNGPVPPSGLNKLDFAISMTPPINQYSSEPILNQNITLAGITYLGASNEYYVTDLNYLNRANLNVNGSAIIAQHVTYENGKQIVIDYLNAVLGFYASGSRKVIEQNSVNFSNEAQSHYLSFQVGISFEDNEFTI